MWQRMWLWQKMGQVWLYYNNGLLFCKRCGEKVDHLREYPAPRDNRPVGFAARACGYYTLCVFMLMGIDSHIVCVCVCVCLCLRMRVQ